MKLFIISLPRSVDRRQTMLSQDFGQIRPEFFDAFDGARGEHHSISRYSEAEAVSHFGVPLTVGEVACYASHYALWQRCSEMGEPIAIIEDDVEVTAHFKDAFLAAHEIIAEHKMIRLAAQHDRPFRELRVLNARYKLVRFLQGPAGTQCYCISPKGADALIAAARSWIEPVDVYIDSFWRHGVTSNAIIPFEAREMDRRMVESTIGNRKIRRTGLAKLRFELSRVRQKVARILFNVFRA